MANRYWVYGGDGNFHNISNWSAISGGSSGASIPSSGDIAVFDANSFIGEEYITNVNIYAEVLCKIHIDPVGTQGKFLINIEENGSLSLQEDLIGLYGFRIVGAEYSFITNNYNIAVTDYVELGSGLGVNVLLGSSVITIGENAINEAWFTGDPDALLDADEATIIFHAGALPDPYFIGGGHTYGSVQFVLSSTENILGIEGNNSFHQLSIVGDGNVLFNNGWTEDVITILDESGLTLQGDTVGGLNLYPNPDIGGVFTLSMVDGAVNAINCNITNSNATGGAIFNALLSDGNVDGGGNSGWNFGESFTIESITVVPEDISIFPGQTVQFSAIGIDTEGEEHDLTDSVGWTSSDEEVATIDESGLATGIAKGKTSITASYSQPA